MKTLLKLCIVAMFGIEILSPFLIGYLNQKEKTRKMYIARETEDIAFTRIEEVENRKDWKDIDFTDDSYSDSKTYTVKE